MSPEQNGKNHRPEKRRRAGRPFSALTRLPESTVSAAAAASLLAGAFAVAAYIF